MFWRRATIIVICTSVSSSEYSIESTAVIPVNLNIGYEFTVLSRGEMRKTQAYILAKSHLVVDKLLDYIPFVQVC